MTTTRTNVTILGLLAACGSDGTGSRPVAEAPSVGGGPGPVVPDLDGELRWRLDVDVPADGSVDVVVTFSGTDDCLQLA